LAGASLGAAAIESLDAQAKLAAYIAYGNGPGNLAAYLKEFVPLAQTSVRDHAANACAAAAPSRGARPYRCCEPKNIILFQFESLDKGSGMGRFLGLEESRAGRPETYVVFSRIH
jgi:hypothetical protein